MFVGSSSGVVSSDFTNPITSSSGSTLGLAPRVFFYRQFAESEYALDGRVKPGHDGVNCALCAIRGSVTTSRRCGDDDRFAGLQHGLIATA